MVSIAPPSSFRAFICLLTFHSFSPNLFSSVLISTLHQCPHLVRQVDKEFFANLEHLAHSLHIFLEKPALIHPINQVVQVLCRRPIVPPRKLRIRHPPLLDEPLQHEPVTGWSVPQSVTPANPRLRIIPHNLACRLHSSHLLFYRTLPHFLKFVQHFIDLFFFCRFVVEYLPKLTPAGRPPNPP